MTSKAIMDDKQLNFNQPLLSVRRGSSTAHPEVEKRKTTKPSTTISPLPFYKSDMNSGPIRNPGVIPFKWEQIPGRPKDERKLKNNDENSSEKPSQESVGSKPQVKNDGTSVSESSSLYKNGGEFEFERSETAREESDSTVSEGENSTYADALDSLSHSESFLNCSVTGVSGLDGAITKPAETHLDPLARDLMMGRFLPAAKAVAAETPHFGSKKPPVVKEQPRYYYAPITLPQHPQAKEEEEDTEDEEDEDNYNDFGRNGSASVKLCGLLPRFCLLNPIPGMRDQVPRPLSSVRKIHKKPANSSAFNNIDKAIRDAVFERRRLAVYKKSDMRVEASRLKHELNELYPHCDPMRLIEASKDSNLTSQRKAQTRSPESLADMIAQEEPALAKATVEKTLYIDSAQITEYRDSNSSPSESRTDSRGRNPSIDYSLHDIKDLYCADNNHNMIPSQDELQTKKQNDHKQETSIRLPDAGVQQFPKKDNKETAMGELPVLPLPLPKSPSESWLSRALPSASSRNRRSYVNPGNLAFRSSPVDPRWEVKSSRLHNKQFELPALTPISEN